MDFHPRPTQLLHPAVPPDAGAVVERSEPAGVFLDDHDDREVVERHRHVEPPHALERGIGGTAGGIGFADRADAPGSVAGTDPGRGVHGDLVAVDNEMSAPGTQLGEALGVQCHAVARPEHMALFLNHREEALPGEIKLDALGLVHDDPQGLQRIDDLDAVSVDVLMQPVVVDGVGQMHSGLLVGVAAVLSAATARNQHEGVFDREVGVVADTGDQKDPAGAVMGVEVGAVIEVAIRGSRPGDWLGHLVHGVFVKWSERHAVSSINRFNSPP